MTTLNQNDPRASGRREGFEVYPMPMFAALETADVDALSQWYQQALGFAEMFRMPPAGKPQVVHLRRMKYQDVLIRPAAAAVDAAACGWSLCLQAGGDVDQFAAHAASVPAIGRVRVEPVADTPWNTRQVRIADPDGRMLVFTQPRFDPEQLRRMQQEFPARGTAGA
jgi:uncharacterized glyoxalase superfamily protein PhnB